MKKILKYITIFSLAIIFMNVSFQHVSAEDNLHVATYITGIGCPHCANVAPGLLKEMVNECDDMIIVEYEIYQQPENSSVIFEFNNNYGSGLGIPLVIFNQDSILTGDTQINKYMTVRCDESQKGIICLPNGECQKWEELDLNDIILLPKIWSRDRIAVRTNEENISQGNNSLIKDFLTAEDPQTFIEQSNLDNFVSPQEVEISGGTVNFKTALEIEGWLLQWNGEDETVVPLKDKETNPSSEKSETKVSLLKTITLALADSVNPCAIAILMMMLIAITTYNPGNRKVVLASGFSFILAVIIMYLVYGVLIVKFFDFVQGFKSIQSIISPILSLLMSIFSLILGVLEIKDYLRYKPGSIGTEMPLSLRPKVQKLMAKVTSPAGAFVLGLFVTVFLLPCTIGPYFILGGLISTGSTNVASMLPYLLLYNVVFVLPMVIVTLIIFFGIKNVKDVQDWKNKNVRKLHLIAGILLTVLAGWVFTENIPAILSLFNF